MIDLTNILGKNENHLIEAKSAKGGFPDSFWETYSAFANTDGGTILLGVEETADHRLYMQDGLKDVDAMLELYDDPDELILGEADDKMDDKMDDKQAINDSASDKLVINQDSIAIKEEIIARLSGQRSDKLTDKVDLSGQRSDKLTNKVDLSGQNNLLDRLAEVISFLQSNPASSKKAIAEHTGWSESSIKRYLQRLVDIDMIVPNGANKNRTYCIKK